MKLSIGNSWFSVSYRHINFPSIWLRLCSKCCSNKVRYNSFLVKELLFYYFQIWNGTLLSLTYQYWERIFEIGIEGNYEWYPIARNIRWKWHFKVKIKKKNWQILPDEIIEEMKKSNHPLPPSPSRLFICRLYSLSSLGSSSSFLSRIKTNRNGETTRTRNDTPDDDAQKSSSHNEG